MSKLKSSRPSKSQKDRLSGPNGPSMKLNSKGSMPSDVEAKELQAELVPEGPAEWAEGHSMKMESKS